MSYVSQYPPAHNDTYVKARSWWTEAPWGDNFRPYFATNPALSVVGDSGGNSWASKETVVTNQRFHIDLGSAKVIRRIYYENYHSVGDGNTAGCKNFSLQGSNDAAAFAATLNFDDNTNWTDLTIAQSTFDQHVAANQADPKYIIVTNTTAYRYYAFKCQNNWGSTYHMGFRRVELQTEVTSASMSPSISPSASASPSVSPSISPSVSPSKSPSASPSVSPSPIPPSVETSAATNIRITSAVGNGEVTDDNDGTITERGICYGISINPTTAGTKETVAGTVGVFSATLPNLLVGKYYYVRAYAINVKGTTYGDNVMFTTKKPVILTF